MKKIALISSFEQKDYESLNKITTYCVQSIEAAEGLVFILPCTTENIKNYIGLFDGFVFSGGADVDPSLYGEENKGSEEIYPEIDKNLYNYIDNIIKAEKPILGICKGMQMINVYFGGKINQDIEGKNLHAQPEKIQESVHTININENTFLKEIFGVKSIPVNSGHHQAISVLGNQLKICALSEDGYIEAIQHDSKNIYGVQFHPEALSSLQPILNWFLGKC